MLKVTSYKKKNAGRTGPGNGTQREPLSFLFYILSDEWR
jgi:hypothetical protein